MLPCQIYLHCNANLSGMAAEWTALQLGNVEFPRLNLGFKNDYPDGFVVYLSLFR